MGRVLDEYFVQMHHPLDVLQDSCKAMRHVSGVEV